MPPRDLIRSSVPFLVVATTFSLGRADVIVVANRLARPVETQILPRNGQPYRLELAGGAVVPIVCEKSASITLRQPTGNVRFQLDANCAYFFGRTGRGVVSLEKIGLGGNGATWQGRRLPGETDAIGSIGLTLAVDEEEPTKRRVWESRLRKRVARASDILEQTCRIRLDVTRTTTWKSNDQFTDFRQSLAEFEKKVIPLPGGVAVGFTSQYRVPKGRTHLGGTRGPLFPHILIREWSQHIGEPERLELLVHELGHHLGAAHSPELDSVMRPMLGDRQSVRAGFLIKFDPVNCADNEPGVRGDPPPRNPFHGRAFAWQQTPSAANLHRFGRG